MIGNGFKLFRIFGENGAKENVQDEQIRSMEKNWLASIFASNKKETSVEQGSSLRDDDRKSDIGLFPSPDLDYQSGKLSLMQKGSSRSHVSEGSVTANGISESVEGRETILPSSRQERASGNGIVDAEGKSDNATTKKKDSTVVSVMKPSSNAQVTTEESAEYATSMSRQGGLKLLISSNEESMNSRESDHGQVPDHTIQKIKADEEAITRLPTPFSALKESDANVKVSISLDFAPEYEQHIGATVLTESVVESKNANFDSNIDAGGIHPAEVSRHIITETKWEVHTGEPLKVDCISSGKDVSFAQGRPVNIIEDYNQVAADNGSDKDAIINVDTGPIETTASQRAQDILLAAEAGSALHSSTQTRVTEHIESEPRKAYEIEVIKSIVYGGLAESISSLSVVSSAAGGNAATLNILALGMANVIGGLFIIAHNLWQLKSNCTEQVLNELTEQGDRHKELLEWRQNFVIHATVAILSYIIFGLVPPVVYGFSFRKNNNKELKLVVVAVASLLCIAVLATGKAYTQRPPKSYLKTVLKYVVLGFVVLGFSYTAGLLIKRLLEKLGLFLFESSSVANLLLPEMMTTKSEWASY